MRRVVFWTLGTLALILSFGVGYYLGGYDEPVVIYVVRQK